MSAHDGSPYQSGHAHSGDEHHGNTSQYFKVFVALCVLTGASFFTYSSAWPFRDTPMVGWVFMMLVSCAKATLVMLFFMHLLWEASWKYVLTIPASIMSLFLMLSLVGDIGQRTRYYDENRWLNAATPQLETAHDHSKDQHAEKDAGHKEGSGSSSKAAH